MSSSQLKRSAGIVLLAQLLNLLNASPIWAQGCAMCKTAAAGAAGNDPIAIFKLNLGMIIMLVPAVVLFSAAMIVIYRYRNAFQMLEDGMVTADDAPASDSVLGSEAESALPNAV